MFSIPHLIVIFVVALIIFGPEKLPELARTLGKVMGEFRRATGDLQSTFEGHLRDLERDAEAKRIGGGPPGGPFGAATVATTDAVAAFGGEPVSPSPATPTPTEPTMIPAEGTVPSSPPNASAIAAGNASEEASVRENGNSTSHSESPEQASESLSGEPASEDPHHHVNDGRSSQS